MIFPILPDTLVEKEEAKKVISNRHDLANIAITTDEQNKIREEVSVFLYGDYSAGLQKEIFCLNFRDKFISHLQRQE